MLTRAIAMVCKRRYVRAAMLGEEVLLRGEVVGMGESCPCSAR